MHLYFSHSYRDVAINTYFLGHMVDEPVQLCADQKSDVWCVAKLERYLFEASGVISIIPKRSSDKEAVGYSPYIGHELDLARRARVERLLFVDREVLERHEARFPDDAEPFDAAAPQRESARHRAAIRQFLVRARRAVPPLQGLRRRGEALLVSDVTAGQRRVEPEIEELLRRADFSVRRIALGRRDAPLDDIRLLETMWKASLCVFLMDGVVSRAQVVLAMAHAHCIPSIRLLHDGKAADPSPTLTGVVHWRTDDELLLAFRRQLDSFLRGMVEPIEMARSGGVEDAARRIGTTQWQAEASQLWAVEDGPALLQHVITADSFVQDEVARARKLLKQRRAMAGREAQLALCRELYDGFKRFRYAYELEAQTGAPPGQQKIRPPSLIADSSAATCIDLACLFAAMLEAAALEPLIAVVRGPTFSHALAGYRALGEPAWPDHGLGVLRRAIDAGDAVFFETTGSVESDEPVTDAEEDERRDKLLDFADAKLVAERLLRKPEVELLHLVDIRTLRR